MSSLLLMMMMTTVSVAAASTTSSSSSSSSSSLRGSDDNNGAVVVSADDHHHRRLAVDFVPLSCNADLDEAVCESWMDYVGTESTHASRVTIPCGVCVTLDYVNSDSSNEENENVLIFEQGLDVQGKLVFPDDDPAYRLQIQTPLLLVQGELQLLARTKPVNGMPNLHLILTTTAADEETMYFEPVHDNAHQCGGWCEAGKKSITVAGGKIMTRGVPADTPSWLHIHDIVYPPNAQENDDVVVYPTSIVVDRSVAEKWAPGAEIVLTSHSLQWDAHQTRTIVGVYEDYPSEDSPDGQHVRLELNAPFDRPTTVKDSVDFATEVGLLSRNILWEGQVGTTETTPAHHGGHFWVLRTPTVHQHVEGLEIRNFGQAGILGRYPIHFHLCFHVPNAVVINNAIRQSNQRCVVVHATHELLVQDNVAVDNAGHCYIVEDGMETHNSFVRNLGAGTHVPAIVLKTETDDKPATFWMTHPTNRFIGNVAAGSIDSGFWFELELRGLMKDQYKGLVQPETQVLEEFVDNVAHANAEFGIRNYPRNGMRPRDGLWNRFDRCKVFRNPRHGTSCHGRCCPCLFAFAPLNIHFFFFFFWGGYRFLLSRESQYCSAKQFDCRQLGGLGRGSFGQFPRTQQYHSWFVRFVSLATTFSRHARK